MLGLTYQQIAVNLCVDTSIVWRATAVIDKQFDDKGTVAARKNKDYHKLSDYEEFAILEAGIGWISPAYPENPCHFCGCQLYTKLDTI